MEEIDLLEKMITAIVQKVGRESTVMVMYRLFLCMHCVVCVHHYHLFFKKKYVVCKTDSVCDSLVPTGQNGTCYHGGITVFENYQMCNVTSKFLSFFLAFL
jgi:hypothetical protein